MNDGPMEASIIESASDSAQRDRIFKPVDLSSNSNVPCVRRTNIQVCIRVRPLLRSDIRSPTSPGKATPSPSVGINLRFSGTKWLSKGDGSAAKDSDDGIGGGDRSSSSTHTRLPSSQGLRNVPRLEQTGDRPADTADQTPPAPVPAWEVAPDASTIIQAPHTLPDPARKSSYSFDKVFGPSCRTSAIYATAVRDVVQSAMEGYHASVFAYGQTSTGKTYTMTGTPTDPGIVPMAVRDCFRFIAKEQSEREYLLRVTFMEIYNEMINDLLAPSPSNASGGRAHSPLITPSLIRIFESKNEGVVVRGLKEEIVTSPEQVFALLSAGEARRQTGATNLNKHSSRSHSIFRLIVESRSRSATPPINGHSPLSDNTSSSEFSNDVSSPAGPVRVSSLSLVDLAGSESIKTSGSTGARQKEGQYINKSLMTLGHVVWKLSELSAKSEGSYSKTDLQAASLHIPYRDSKLTRLLQPSLSGNAQICIVCNISPLAKNVEESHNTLKFASRAKRIKQNACVTEVVDDKTLLQNYRDEIEALKRQLREAKRAQIQLQHTQIKRTDSGSLGMDLETTAADDEDAHVLVEAIQNLEKLILKTSSAEVKKQHTTYEVGKEETKSNGSSLLKSPATRFTARDDNVGELDVSGTRLQSSGIAARPDSGTGARLNPYFKNSAVLRLEKKTQAKGRTSDNADSNFLPDNRAICSFSLSEKRERPEQEASSNDGAGDNDSNTSVTSFSGHTVKENGIGMSQTKDSLQASTEPQNASDDDVSKMEENSLLSELHRIQGLLGSVLKRKNTPRQDRSILRVASVSPVQSMHLDSFNSLDEGEDNENCLVSSTATTNDGTYPTPRPLFRTPSRDREVERLRLQLQQQKEAASLRKADSTFLQSQLTQKDDLLKEVSNVLEVVEKRQVELEKENNKLQREWARTAAILKSREADVVRTMQLLKSREMEISKLRNQIAFMTASKEDEDDIFSSLI